MMSGGVECGEDEIKVTATRFEYAQNASAVTYAIGEEWCWDPEEANPCAAVTQYEVTFAREFRYDGARARYLSAELDVASFKQGSFVRTTRKWTDFDGDNAYQDRMMTPGELAYATGFEPGIGRIRRLFLAGDFFERVGNAPILSPVNGLNVDQVVLQLNRGLTNGGGSGGN